MLVNPAFVYSFVWGLALLLYTQYWSNVFLELSNLTIYYILCSMFVTIVSWFFFIVTTKSTRIGFTRISYAFSHHSEKKIKIFFKIWMVGMLVELLYFRDLPILSLVGLSNMSYHDFGLPSLHGFLNAIILSISMYMLYQYTLYNKKIYLFYYFSTLLVPIVQMNRGMLTSLLIESLFVILVFRNIKIKTIVKIIFFILLFIYAFGIFGELRYSGNANDLYAVFQISDYFPEFLPKSIMWVYMYITSSINNIENIISNFSDVNFEPYKAMFGLIPSVIRVYLEMPIQQDLVQEAFNVSSFMPNYLGAFGIYGSILFYFISSLITMAIYYRYTKKFELSFGFTLVILLHSIALSVFSDFFALQVYVFQIIIQFIIFSKIKFNLQNRNTYVQQ